ncbi:hypothetical protein MSAN_00830700 [Mycena sanguinolenta]|uniref:Uncharacterized protein n=1 Tax=Mycena sanguinolenta TaxID=230812 RepID=A0A8H6Z1L7_9AGAR|nr:hypothetical protein MSAN_00830700 [Mycena sanguinolenta]
MFSSLKNYMLANLRQFLLYPFTTLPTPLLAPIVQDEITEVWDDKDWYVSSSGLLTRDPIWLWDPNRPEDGWDIDPIYFAPTFEHAVKYLPLCKGFEAAFERDEYGHFRQVRSLYFVVDGIPKIFMHEYVQIVLTFVPMLSKVDSSLGNLGTSLEMRMDGFTQQQIDATPNSVLGTYSTLINGSVA